ncbi:MAG: hypothetical protein AB1540_10585 [Bdellovibrionota bacterium]
MKRSVTFSKEEFHELGNLLMNIYTILESISDRLTANLDVNAKELASQVNNALDKLDEASALLKRTPKDHAKSADEE